jgi:putative transposase
MPSGLRRRILAMANMCLVASVKLLATPEQQTALVASIERANLARSWIAEQGRRDGRGDRTALHRLIYYEARDRFGVCVQMVVRAIGSVVECFRRDRRVVPRFRPRKACTAEHEGR